MCFSVPRLKGSKRSQPVTPSMEPSEEPTPKERRVDSPLQPNSPLSQHDVSQQPKFDMSQFPRGAKVAPRPKRPNKEETLTTPSPKKRKSVMELLLTPPITHHSKQAFSPVGLPKGRPPDASSASSEHPD